MLNRPPVLLNLPLSPSPFISNKNIIVLSSIAAVALAFAIPKLLSLQ